MSQLPFSRDAFLDVFAIYNTRFWPVALLLWLASGAAVVLLVAGRADRRRLLALLAVLWAWGGVAYHALLFSRINPAAPMFAAAFLAEAVALAWYARRNTVGFAVGSRRWSGIAGWVLIAYGLLYPLLVASGEHAYPRMPTFGVPCPTTILTIGLLLLVDGPIPLPLAVVPALWSVVAGSAAFTLGMPVDLALPVAGVLLAIALLQRRALAVA
jgi:uncharacterized protein DUF6064